VITNEMALTIVAVLGSAMVAGVTAAAIYFKSQRTRIATDIQAGDQAIHKEISKLWGEMRERISDQHENDLKVVSLQEKSVNNVRRLDEIFKATQTTNDKIDTLSENLGRAVLAFRAGKRED
jgi:hypothetical protein